MTKPIFVFLLFTFMFRLTHAQLSPEIIAENMQEAEEYILSEDFNEALIILNTLREKGTENSNIDFKTGFCYLNTVAEKNKALPYLKKASENISKNYDQNELTETKAPVEAMLYLGDAYRYANKLDEAIKCYKQFANLADTQSAREISARRIKESQMAKLLQRKPVEVKWEILPENINQGIANLNPVLSANGSTMVFTRKMKFYDAILISHNKDGIWEEPSNITTQLGSDGEFYPSALSHDGTRLLLSSYNALSGQDIYESTWSGSRWTKIRKLDDGINSKYVEENASYAPDGKTIFFASNRDNGLGGFDIYKSELRADKSWSRPINLGPLVNTSADEKAPHLISDGNILVFSSKGHLCMGGYDIFYIDYPLHSGAVARNLGYPLNTVENDLSFYPLQTKNSGFIAKHDINGNGETDIFRTDYNAFSNFALIPVKTTLLVSGINPDDSISFTLVDALINDTLDRKNTTGNPEHLEYTLYPGNFRLTAESPKMQTSVSDFTVPEKPAGNNVQIPLTISFLKTEMPAIAQKIVETKDTFQISNLTFSFNSHQLNSTDYTLLDKIASFVSVNPSVSLVITGYTDNLGQEIYNFMLSEKRAGSVKQYLLKKGIENSRIKTAGAGNTGFIAINTREEGRKFNRRVEIKFENIPENIILINESKVPEKLRLK